MKKSEYLKIVLDGYVNNKDFLSEHFYREFKEAEKKHVGFVEFNAGLKDVHEYFMSDIKRQYHERKREVEQIRILEKEKYFESIKKSKISEEKKKKAFDKIEEYLKDQLPKMSDFSINLTFITNDAHVGVLWLHDIEMINAAIIKFSKKQKEEKQGRINFLSQLIEPLSVFEDDWHEKGFFYVKYRIEDMLSSFKEEVMINLIEFREDQRKPYLIKMQYNLTEEFNIYFITEKDINEYYKKYKTTERDILGNGDHSNLLYKKLSYARSSTDFSDFEAEFIQDTFSDFIHRNALKEALDFVNEQLDKYAPQPLKDSKRLATGIKTEVLEKCVRLMNFDLTGDERIFKELLDPEFDINDCAMEFRKELDKNVLNVETLQGKIDIIRHYIFEFREIQALFSGNRKFLFDGSLLLGSKEFEHTDANGISRKLNEYESYVVICWELYDIIFSYIQAICAKYKVNFEKLCKELDIDTNLFQPWTSLGMFTNRHLPENQLLNKDESFEDKLSNDLNSDLQDINTENHFCKSMPIKIAEEHFKIFTESKSKNGQPFLTVKQLDVFIKRAFHGNTDLPKQKFNQAPKGEKLLIQNEFYYFFYHYSFEYFNNTQCQDVFIKLLTDNFVGWDYDKVANNFTPKTKKRIV